MGYESYRGADHKEWAAAPVALDSLMQKHEMEYVNQEEDGCDSLSGDWWLADDDALTIIHGTFGNDHSPGASHYTYADVYDNEEEYREALAEWEGKEEYLPASAHCPKCGGACVDYDDEQHGEYSTGKERDKWVSCDYACDQCEQIVSSDDAVFVAD